MAKDDEKTVKVEQTEVVKVEQSMDTDRVSQKSIGQMAADGKQKGDEEEQKRKQTKDWSML